MVGWATLSLEKVVVVHDGIRSPLHHEPVDDLDELHEYGEDGFRNGRNNALVEVLVGAVLQKIILAERLAISISQIDGTRGSHISAQDTAEGFGWIVFWIVETVHFGVARSITIVALVFPVVLDDWLVNSSRGTRGRRRRTIAVVAALGDGGGNTGGRREAGSGCVVRRLACRGHGEREQKESKEKEEAKRPLL